MSTSAINKPQAVVKQYNGAPTIFVNNEPVPGVGFWRGVDHDERYLADFAKVGVKIVWFTVSMPQYWKAPGVYDYSELDAAWERMFTAMPTGWFIPRLMIYPPTWWTNANPGELRLTEEGKPYEGVPDEYLNGQLLPSPSSRKWRDDVCGFIRAYITHHENSPYAARIIGYHLSSEQSEEWFYWGGPSIDYHPAAQADFRHYLAGVYDDDAALQRAWHQPDASLANAQIPSYQQRRGPAAGDFFSPTSQQNVVDYYHYKHNLIVEMITEYAGLAKQLSGRRALVGIFYGYQLQPIPRGQLDSGHYALRKLLSSPDVDYLSSPTCYTGRELGTGYSYFMSPQYSLRLHDKLWIDENDIRTHVPAPGNQGFGKTATLPETIAMQRRELANALCNGAAFWWMDQGGGWYDDPALLAELGRLREIAVKAASCNRASAAEIAVVLDERSVMWRGSGKGLQSYQGIVDIGHIGAPVDFLLLEDLAEARPYRLYLMKYCYRINRRLLELVHRLKRNGSWIVWVDRPGWVDEDLQTIGPANMEAFTNLLLWPDENSIVEPDPELSERIGCPVRTFEEWTSVFSPDVPSDELLRRICHAASVHLYLETGDVVYADRSFIAVHTQTAGTKRLYLPSHSNLYDLVNNQQIVKGNNAVDLTMGARETALFFRGSAEEWQGIAH
ncbi:MAG: beta-galactosidase [Anaerolineae bacterium]